MSTASAASTPQLVFRLVGRWSRIELDSPEAIATSTREIARELLGSTDDRATQRARVRRGLADAATQAAAAEARLMLFQTEFSSGEPMAATLTLFERDDLRLSPAIGTDPDTVLRVLEQALPAIDPVRAKTAVRRRSRDTDVVRTHAIEETVETEDGAKFTQRKLVAQYWYPQPGTKQLLLLVLHSPLGDIPHMLLNYFDAIVAASSFAVPTSA